MCVCVLHRSLLRKYILIIKEREKKRESLER